MAESTKFTKEYILALVAVQTEAALCGIWMAITLSKVISTIW